MRLFRLLEKFSRIVDWQCFEYPLGSCRTPGFLSHPWVPVAPLGSCHTPGFLSHPWVPVASLGSCHTPGFLSHPYTTKHGLAEFYLCNDNTNDKHSKNASTNQCSYIIESVSYVNIISCIKLHDILQKQHFSFKL